MKKAFTMIELVFVIVVLGILSSVAIYKMAVTRDDAQIVKGKANVAAIRNAISLTRSVNMLEANTIRVGRLDDATINREQEELFDGNATTRLLDYPIISRNSEGHWMKTGTNTYVYNVMNLDIVFTYTPNDGRFTCSTTTANAEMNEMCRNLTQ